MAGSPLNFCSDCVFNFFRNGVRKCLANGERKSKALDAALADCKGNWYSPLPRLDNAAKDEGNSLISAGEYATSIFHSRGKSFD